MGSLVLYREHESLHGPESHLSMGQSVWKSQLPRLVQA